MQARILTPCCARPTRPRPAQSVIFANRGGTCGLRYINANGDLVVPDDDTPPSGSEQENEVFSFPDDKPIEILKRTVQRWQIGNAGTCARLRTETPPSAQPSTCIDDRTKLLLGDQQWHGGCY